MGLSGDTVQTMIVMWVFTWIAMTIMALRLIMRKVRGQKFETSDRLTMLCMFFSVARCATTHVVLLWGNNNFDEAFRAQHVFGATELYQREVGGKLTLANRTFYNSYIWLQKCVVLLLCKKLLFNLPWMDLVINIYWGILAATYVAIQVATFIDCRPLYLYWQVEPDPGSCSQAHDQLITLGAVNIATDIMLIGLPMPSLMAVRRSFVAKLRLVAIFSLGIYLVIISIIRLPINFSHGLEQLYRTTWASTESLVAAIVANFPTLYSLRKHPLQPVNSSAATESRPAKKRAGWSQMSSDNFPNEDDFPLTPVAGMQPQKANGNVNTLGNESTDEELRGAV